MTTKEKIAVMQAYLDGRKIQTRMIGKDGWWNNESPSWDWNHHEYRIKPEEVKPQRMTNRQLAEWLAKGFGSWKTKRSPTVYMDISYPTFEENISVPNDILICPWGSDEWIEPTVDIYERDCKGVKI